MKQTFLPFLLLILSTTMLVAGPGDTIVVQTIDFNTPVNPGWNSPREGKYLFPPDSVSFQKILMYYTLKCDPNQSPACGEWDYTTHTQLLYHTGEYDSNLYSHPNFIVNGGTPDTFMYMDQASWKYFPYFEYFNSTNPLSTTQIGSGSSTTLLSLSGVPDARQAYLVRSDELLTAGMSAGDITGLRINFSAAGGYFNKFTIRVKATDSTELTPGSYVDDGLLTVYSRNTSFNTTGWNTIPFSFPFSWDGSSNLIIELSFANHIPADQTMILADETAFNSGISSAGPDYFLDYEGADGVDIPVDAFEDLDSMITVTLWQFGDPELQPQNNTIFEAVDHNNKRILNVHLPWSDSKVYWDAGNDGGGYDRLYRTASAEEFRGQWNHWAFVKDCHTGEMSVFLNGELWIFAYGKYKTMDSIVRFTIGASPNNKYYYDGYVDEFRVWNIALDQETIREWMFKEVDASHPDYENLLAYYKFTEGSGLVTADEITGDDAILKGYPGWMDYAGSNRFREFAQSNFRPQMVFEQGSYDPGSLDSLLTVDTLAQSQLMIVMYEDTLNPVEPTDTLSKWPSYYYNYVYDENGVATDSTLAPPDGILYREDHPYYGPPYEILIKYELARFITPYGNGLSLGGGFTWIYDVTDFRPFLSDSVHLQAGNFQELLDMRFYMIEGTPPRDVLKIDRMWHGYYKLSTFEQDVPPMTVGLDTNTSTYKLKITTSGHEFSNSTNCAEFCQKTHWVDVDNVTQYSWEIIDECATNALYPQGGTWIFDRAGWCPGAKVTERHLEITPFIAADSVILDYNCDYDPYGRYSVTSYLFSYGEPNFTLDAAVEDIMAPNKRKIFGRFNPMCGKPEIKIKNTGSTPLTSVHDYAEQVRTRGLAFMNSPGYDPVSVTGQVAGGCNLVLFTTGRGSVFGFKPAPCIKICSNSATYERLIDDMDLNAGRVLAGEAMADVAADLLTLLVAVASGQPTKSEGQDVGEAEFSPWNLVGTL